MTAKLFLSKHYTFPIADEIYCGQIEFVTIPVSGASGSSTGASGRSTGASGSSTGASGSSTGASGSSVGASGSSAGAGETSAGSSGSCPRSGATDGRAASDQQLRRARQARPTNGTIAGAVLGGNSTQHTDFTNLEIGVNCRNCELPSLNASRSTAVRLFATVPVCDSCCYSC